MWTSLLDLHTMHVEHAVLLAAFTVLTVVNSFAHHGERGTRWFPIYTFAAFIGAVLIALRGSIPDPLSIVGGCILFPVAYFFLHLSLTEFFGRSFAFWRLQILCIALSAASLLQWGWVHPNTSLRLAIYSACLAVQLGLSTAFVARQFASSPGSLRWAAGMMAGILALISANNLLRTVILLFQGAPANYLRGGRELTFTMLLTSVLQGAATIAFVWMTAARLHEELRLEASTDPLTRLLNRRALAAWAEQEIAISRQNGWPLSAILIDLDEFKSINDAWGHLCGDTVLLSVANLLASSVRPRDQIGRLGGDEFVVLLPRTPEEVALAVGQRLQQSLGALKILHQSRTLAVSASLGVAELGGLGLTWEQLIQRCDVALYRAKALGGNRALVH